MNMRELKFYLILFLISGFPVFLFSAQIDENTALEKAQQFYNQNEKSALRSASDFQLVYTCKDTTKTLLRSASANENIYYYIFNVGNNGFVIVSGNDATKSILGYSSESAFSVNNIPANLQSWIDFYKSEIKYAIDAGLRSSVLDSTTTSALSSTDSVKPLLGNIKWDQDNPYNYLCPYNKNTGEHAETGCIATAMAQIMKYYNWPVTGTGSNKDKTAYYGTLSVTFNKTKYNWSHMLDSYELTTTGVQDTAVATLMYHCGVAANMDYNIAENGGSSAYLQDVGNALINNFGYSSNAQLYERNYFNSPQWDSLIKTELKAGRPIIYTGSTESISHAFLCDGYDTNDLFHINWGWGGYYNGYFELSALDYSSSGANKTIDGFSQSQTILAGIQKSGTTLSVNYQLGIYKDGMASLAPFFPVSIKDSVSFGVLNTGLNSFTGKFGIGLFKNGVYQSLLAAVSSNALPNYYGYFDDNKLSFNISLNGLYDGSYQLYAVYMPADSSSWSIIKGTNNLNNYLNVVINNGTVTISGPVNTPDLSLTQPLVLSGKAYNNRTAKFNLVVKNAGTEFYSNLGIYIYSPSDTSAHQYVDYGTVCIPADATDSFTIDGNISCAAGNYYAVAVYDTTNSFSTDAFSPIGPANYNPIVINILAEPATPVLKLNGKITLSCDTIVYRNEIFTLNANITNTGGYFDSELVAFVFPPTGGASVSYLDPKTVYIDQGETQFVTLTGSLSIDSGSYIIGLCYKDSDSYEYISPKDSDFLYLKLIDLPSQNVVSDTSSINIEIYPNPVTSVLNIQTSLVIKQIEVIDLFGRILRKRANTSSLNISSLQSGIYVLRIETDQGKKKIKFIKK